MTKRRTPPVVTALAALVLAAGCGTTTAAPRDPAGSGDRLDARRLGGPCPGGTGGDKAPAGSYLTEPGIWVRVDALDRGSRTRLPDSEFSAYRGTFVTEGGDAAVLAALPDPVDRLEIHDPVAGRIGEALEAGATVVAHVRPGYRPRDVAFALALKGDDYAFLGPCAYELTEHARRELGDGAAAELRALVGRPSKVVKRTLDVPHGFPANVRIDALPAAGRAGLRQGWFTVVAPAGWTLPYRLCAGIRRGWGGCVDLSTPAGVRQRARLWFAPGEDDPVRIWLMERTGDLSYPAPGHESFGVETSALAAYRDPVELRLDLGNPPGAASYATGGRVLLGAPVEFEVRGG